MTASEPRLLRCWECRFCCWARRMLCRSCCCCFCAPVLHSSLLSPLPPADAPAPAACRHPPLTRSHPHSPPRSAVDVVCREGPRYVLELAKFGAEFTRHQGGGLHLTREGGHSARRIVHAADATGAEIERALVAAARAAPSISFFEHHLAVDLLSEWGINMRWWLWEEGLGGQLGKQQARLAGVPSAPHHPRSPHPPPNLLPPAVDEVEGVRYCLGADVLDQEASRMTRWALGAGSGQRERG